MGGARRGRDVGRSCARAVARCPLAMCPLAMCPALDGGDVPRTRCAPPLTSRWSPIPVTYAGGARNMEDCALIDKLGGGKVDVTIGSALDIFGGALPYKGVVEWDAAQAEAALQPALQPPAACPFRRVRQRGPRLCVGEGGTHAAAHRTHGGSAALLPVGGAHLRISACLMRGHYHSTDA